MLFAYKENEKISMLDVKTYCDLIGENDIEPMLEIMAQAQHAHITEVKAMQEELNHGTE